MARSTYRTAKTVKLPSFDPTPSAKAGVALLKAAGVKFAIAGRVAVWTYVPPERQAYTKDVDFAVAHRDLTLIAKAAADAGRRLNPLPIGGWGLRERGIAVDFIDRHPEFTSLFDAAVEAAQRSRRRRRVGAASVPVVPKEYLIAMKIATLETKDEQDAESLILTVPDRGYAPLRALVRRHLGPLGAMRLDAIARRVGHPGPGRKPLYS